MKRIAIFFLISLLLISNTSCQNKSQEGHTQSTETIYVLDGHTHHGFPELKKKSIEKEMQYLNDLGYQAINFAMPVNKTSTNNLLSRLRDECASIKNIASETNVFQVTEASSFQPDSGFISCFFSLEYFHGVFNSDLDIIDQYKNLGIQYITLINNQHDVLFKVTHGRKELTDFGKKVISRMNMADLKIDLSHLTEEEQNLVLLQSKKPVLISHRNCKHIAAKESNISNKTLKLLKQNGGMMMLSFSTNGVFKDKKQKGNEIEKVVDHIDHINQYLGIDMIGFGTDLQAYGRYMPEKLKTPQTYHLLKNELLKRNYSKADIEKIFYKNYIAFMQ